MDAPRFLIIDSGVGGLTIAQQIQQKMPYVQICYVADNAAFPYGSQDETTLISRLLQLLPPLQQRYQPDIIVIACNTASTVVLDPLRQQTETPIIGVVPAIKPAAALSQSKHLALLATPGTIARQYTQDLINQFAEDCQVTKLASNQLAHQAEKKLREVGVDMEIIRQELAPLANRETKVDTLILGCTHFPFLKEEIGQCIAPHIQIIDSAEAIARRAQQLLPLRPEQITQKQANLFLFTAEDPHAHTLETGIKHLGFSKIQFLSKDNTEITQKSSAS